MQSDAGHMLLTSDHIFKFKKYNQTSDPIQISQ